MQFGKGTTLSFFFLIMLWQLKNVTKMKVINIVFFLNIFNWGLTLPINIYLVMTDV